MLSSSTRAELDDGRFVVSDFGAPAAPDMGMLRTAVRDSRRLAIVYRDERERLIERTCLPLAVVYYIEVTVVAAWCELRDNFRHFRVDRIVACDESLLAVWRRIGRPSELADSTRSSRSTRPGPTHWPPSSADEAPSVLTFRHCAAVLALSWVRACQADAATVG